MRGIEDAIQRQRTQSSAGWKRLAIAAILVLIVTVGAGTWHIAGLQEQLALEGNTNIALQQRIDSQQQSLARQQRVLAYLQGINVALIPLDATSKDLQYAGRALWAERGLLLMVNDLPALPPDRTYQLWAITRDQKKVSAGIFQTSHEGEALFEVTSPIPSRDQTQGLAVTLEPAGGVLQPTGTTVLASPNLATP